MSGSISQSPLISVQMPVYNRAEYLREAAESIAAQTVREIELVMVDDGSTDDTPRIMDELASEYSGRLVIRCIHQEHLGIAAARNRALRESRGSFAAFLDSDDLWVPEKAEKQLSFFGANPGCEIVFCRYRNFFSPGETEITPEKEKLAGERDQWCLAAAMVRRKVFDRVGPYSEKMIVGEDSEWVTRARLLGVNIDFCIEEELYLRRIHASNITLGYGGGGANYARVLAASIRNANRIRRKGIADFSADSSL